MSSPPLDEFGRPVYRGIDKYGRLIVKENFIRDAHGKPLFFDEHGNKINEYGGIIGSGENSKKEFFRKRYKSLKKPLHKGKGRSR